MNITFQFNARSSGQNIPTAKALAERCGGVIENNIYKIQFTTPDDENLQKLYGLVGNLKGSLIILGEREPIDVRKFFLAANCQEKLLCKGVCSHVRFGYYSLEQFFEHLSEYIANGVLSVNNEKIISVMAKFLKAISDTRFSINKQLFLDYFKKETEMEALLCPNYNIEKIQSEIEKLPEEVELISPEEYQDRYEPQEFDEENFIKAFLATCEFDAKLTFHEILECSETVHLLLRSLRMV